MIEGKKISELIPTTLINDACCFPILSKGATKKITFGVLLENIIGNLDLPNLQEIQSLKNNVEKLNIDFELTEKQIKTINSQIEELQNENENQEIKINKYIKIVQTLQDAYNKATISGGIVDNELNIHSANPVQNKVISKLIPIQANEENKLADKDFVNSSIQTETANFRGNWETWADVPTDADNYPEDYAGNKTPTVNDYMVVKDYKGGGTWRFKYCGNWETNGKEGWQEEYQVNETPFTSEQLASINSGITKEKLNQLNGMYFPVGTILSGLFVIAPFGFLFCDGSEIAIADYPELYSVIGSLPICQTENEGFFKLPDLRETVLVGAGENTTLTIEDHDVYNIGEFKDDQVQEHTHTYGRLKKDREFIHAAHGGVNFIRTGDYVSDTTGTSNANSGRSGTTTHGKQVGVNYIIKF